LFTSATNNYRHINPSIAHQPQRSVYHECFIVPLLTLSEGSSLPYAVPYTGPQECSASSPHVSNPSPPSYQALSSLSPFHPTASNVPLTPLLFIFSRHRSFQHLVAPSNDKWAEHHLHPCFKLDVVGVLDIAPLPPPLLNTGISKTNAEPLGADATSSPFLRPCSRSCPKCDRMVACPIAELFVLQTQNGTLVTSPPTQHQWPCPWSQHPCPCPFPMRGRPDSRAWTPTPSWPQLHYC
jgi:hypothetical protein